MSKNKCTRCGSTTGFYDDYSKVCDVCRGLATNLHVKYEWMWPAKINGLERAIVRCRETLKKD